MTNQNTLSCCFLTEEKSWVPGEDSYTLTLGPGVVRYLKFKDVLNSDVENLIKIIREYSANPQIKAPDKYKTANRESVLSPGLEFRHIDALISDSTWEDRLRIHKKFGTLYEKQGVPPVAYRSFHCNLKLKELNFEEFLTAWVKNAWRDVSITESFETSSNHVIFLHEEKYSYMVEKFVFLKTSFVLDRLTAIKAQEELEAQRKLEEARQLEAKERQQEELLRETLDLERLKKSSYNTFVYIMEDVRNGYFKIGRSKTPGKRERTLQSEVPSVTLRFSIPSDEEHEKQLHDHFDENNLRGEWFSLTPDELLWVVSYLKINGDASRASVDYEWLGRISFEATAKK